MRITDRYASAIRSSNMKSEERTTFGDSDVIAAFGRADRQLSEHDHALAVPLTRLFMGDDTAARDIVVILSAMVRRKAKALRTPVTWAQADDVARACLAWFANGACKPCGGHGQMVIKGSTTLGGPICKDCRGAGRIPFEKQFRHDWRDLARWLVSEMEREQGRAGPAAMRALAPKLVL